MKRYAFKMKLKPGNETEYTRRHAALWPELEQVLHAAGISDYSIFLDRETRTLFAVQKQTEPSRVADLASQPVMRRWWEHMAPLMEVNPDQSPICLPLEEVFHLD